MALFTLNPIKSLLSYLTSQLTGLLQSSISQRTASVASANDIELHTLKTSGTLTIGYWYEITVSGTADWTNVGASDNNVGTQFVATGTTPTAWTGGTLAEAKTTWDGLTITVSGTTTIQTISRKFLNNGATLHLIASGAWTLEHEAGSTGDAIEISLKGGANKTVVSGDEIKLQYRSDGKWYESYSKIAVNVGGLLGVNVETLSANKTLTPNTDKITQVLASSVNSTHDITLSATATEGDYFVIKAFKNTYGKFSIKDATQASAEIWALNYYSQITVVFNGTNWVVLKDGDYTSESYNYGSDSLVNASGVAMGGEAYANNSVAIGNDANAAQAASVCVGNSAYAAQYGVAIGNAAEAAYPSNAIGRDSKNNSKGGATALGTYAENERIYEFMLGTENTFGIIYGKGYTLDDSFKTIWHGNSHGDDNYVILANQAHYFDITFVAACRGVGAYKVINIKGIIVRDDSNNTAIVGSVTKTTLVESGSVSPVDTSNWDAQAIADDTNESLLIQVKSEPIIINGDTAAQLSNLQLQVDSTGYWSSSEYTDGYWELTDVAGTRTFTLYTSVGKTAEWATGTLVGDGTMTLTGLRMSGTIDVAYTADDTDTGNTWDLAQLTWAIKSAFIQIIK